MNRRWMAVALCAGITACAASGPNSPAPAANPENPAESTAETVVQNQAPAPASPTSEVVVVDIPEKSETAPEAGITEVPARSDIVCKRERTTGSNRARKVCRSRAKMDKDERDGKKAFEDLHRSQREYD